jgi:type IV pilus assembly protein PilV
VQLIAERRTQNGSGLIEAMISVFVVSIGFLGFAGLQITGLAAANDSMFRSKAVYLSSQMADRVRANLPGVIAGSYNNYSGSVTSPGCILSGCTSAQIAQNDYYEWSTEIAGLLPAGAGVICKTSDPSTDDPQCDGAGEVYAIKVSWTEKGNQHVFVTTLRP